MRVEHTRQRSSPSVRAHHALERAAEIVACACDRWSLPELAGTVQLAFSPRLKRSLALSYPGRHLVRLSRDLIEAPAALFRQVVVHETAHIAAWDIHGPGIRPHGVEWRTLVERAGEPAHVRIAGAGKGAPSNQARRWLHRCPVCQGARIAGRQMLRWRCDRCTAAGLPGHLHIEAMSP